MGRLAVHPSCVNVKILDFLNAELVRLVDARQIVPSSDPDLQVALGYLKTVSG